MHYGFVFGGVATGGLLYGLLKLVHAVVVPVLLGHVV